MASDPGPELRASFATWSVLSRFPEGSWLGRVTRDRFVATTEPETLDRILLDFEVIEEAVAEWRAAQPKE